MKKILGILCAAFLVVALASPAMAAFVKGDFLVMTYGADVELATNMGAALTDGTKTDLYDAGLGLFTSADNFADLNISGFAGLVSGTQLERYDMYFAVAKGDEPEIRTSAVYGFTGASDTIIARYEFAGTTGSDRKDATLATSDNASFTKKMIGNYGIGSYANFNKIAEADGFVSLGALDASFTSGVFNGQETSVEMDIYHFYSDNWGGTINEGGLVGFLTYGIDANGDVYAQTSAVPIPASVLLLGSGLLGLFGIRRKNS